MEAYRLAASELACRRGDRLLFTGLSLDLAAGQAMQVTGPNGTGKSSLMRILAGLMRPFAGTVEHSGAIALMDEHPALDEQMALGKALAFWDRVDQADGGADRLAMLGLTNLLDVPVRYLSTGQRKRAALSRLLGQNAPIWLLDEPLNGLDKAAVALVEELVTQHCQAGGMAIVASHQDFALPDIKYLSVEDYPA